MSEVLTINSQAKLSEAIRRLQKDWAHYKFLTLTIRAGKDRSLSQNAISHVWYAQVAKASGEYGPDEIKSLCKLHFGVPILAGEDSEFAAFHERALEPLTYEEQVQAMRYVPVTSLMTSEQMKRYLDEVQAYFAQQGIQLDYPEAA